MIQTMQERKKAWCGYYVLAIAMVMGQSLADPPARFPRLEVISSETSPEPLVEIDGKILQKNSPEKLTAVFKLEQKILEINVDRKIALRSPFRAGNEHYPTPRGKFKIIAKQERYRDNLFGHYLDANGKILVSHVFRHCLAQPSSSTFSPSDRLYYMRFTESGLAIQAGNLTRFHSTDGSLLLPEEAAKWLYELFEVGGVIEIKK